MRNITWVGRVIVSVLCGLGILPQLAMAKSTVDDVCAVDSTTDDFRARLSELPAAGSSLYDAGRLTSHQQLARDVLAELINIDTTDATGDNTRAAGLVAARFRHAGYGDQDVKVLAPAPRKGNLVVRFQGSDKRCKPLLLLAHLDVVNADRAAWDHDPFELIEEEGYLYGRGVSDDKDEAAIHVANMLRLQAEGFQPRRTIIVALTSDEEGGDFNGVQWLLREHPELLKAAIILNEGGGGLLFEGRRLANEVQASEKGYQTYEIVFHSPGGHSSMPLRDNAIVAAGKAMVAFDQHRFPVKLNAVTRNFFARSAPLFSGQTRWAMESILQDPPDPKAVEILSEMPFNNASLRTTCVPTMVQGGHAENALPQSVTVTVNCRLLPTESRDNVTQTLASLVGDDVELNAKPNDNVAPGISMQTEVLDAIEAVSHSVWPEVPTVPIMGPGGTDSRFFRSEGIPAYGVNGVFIDVEDDRGHARNERIRSRSFYEGLEFMYRLTKALSE